MQQPAELPQQAPGPAGMACLGAMIQIGSETSPVKHQDLKVDLAILVKWVSLSPKHHTDQPA